MLLPALLLSRQLGFIDWIHWWFPLFVRPHRLRSPHPFALALEILESFVDRAGEHLGRSLKYRLNPRLRDLFQVFAQAVNVLLQPDLCILRLLNPLFFRR